jgi:hypothetical protein
MAIIKIIPNKPLIVNLLYASAKEKQGQYGLQYLYTLEGGHALFVPPIAHDEIQKLHAGPGEPFTLTKSIGEGNQAVWKVERVVQNDRNVQPVAQPSAPSTDETKRPASDVNAVVPKFTTNGNKQVAVMPAAAPTLATPQSRTLARQLIAAIDAGIAATAYAKTQNFPFELTSRDICALAITGGIQVFKEGVY